MTSEMTREELLALPATIDLVTAAQILGIGRTKAYELARRGEFPVPVLCLGNRSRVVTENLLDLLGVARHPAPVIQRFSREELEERRKVLTAELSSWRSQDEIRQELYEIVFLLGEATQ